MMSGLVKKTDHEAKFEEIKSKIFNMTGYYHCA